MATVVPVNFFMVWTDDFCLVIPWSGHGTQVMESIFQNQKSFYKFVPAGQWIPAVAGMTGGEVGQYKMTILSTN